MKSFIAALLITTGSISCLCAQLQLNNITLNELVRLNSKLNYGKYSVGFQIFHEFDLRRSFLPKYDYYKVRTDFNVNRPMQIAVWYPANISVESESMKYKDYIGFETSEIDFDRDTKEYKAKHINDLLTSYTKDERQGIDDFFSKVINVFDNAQTQKGDFPLVIYAPPQDSPFFSNSVLCEYLASKGYIVVATSAKGEYTKLQESSPRSMYVQAEDMAFLLEFGKRFTNSDRVGTIGFSRGGLANLLFAVKNKNIDATVSLDGSVFSQGWLDDMEGKDYFMPKELTSNLLLITKNMSDPEKNPSTFYDSVKYADKCLIRFDHGNHGFFSSHDLIESLILDTGLTDKEKDNYLNFHAEVIAYVGEFMNYYLKGEGIFKEHESKRFKHSFSFRKPENQTIAPGAINFWIMEKGIDYALGIVNDIEKSTIGYVSKLNWRELNQIADLKIKDQQYSDAIKILILSDRAFPQWYKTNYKLGECYKVLGNRSKAIEYFKIALRDNPRDVESANALKAFNINYNYHDQYIKSEKLVKYIGIYESSDGKVKEVAIQNSQLVFISPASSDSMSVWPYEDLLFVSDETDPKSNIQILFEMDKLGKIVSLKTRGMNSGRLGETYYKK